ncbi:hypothetical protein N7517_011642 [Penicillium concentricum]|uniref:Calcium channel YVC1-like C-terminal transmembrane domain-containing protein n=1 Tax=Penicillium concentricum TaxID=293559 RepID=A0A9W9RBC7_9EURO|nr:uncharacterized protein N7517_011642 [Penicillium concentricum]KAJ5357033.1 hypothetical protein N7517_011642 [Penicillium concentricum]
MDHTEIPVIEIDEPLFDVLPKLFNFISMAVGEMAYTFEQMLYGSQGHRLRQLVHALAEDTHNPFIIVALMILKWDFTTATEDDWGLNESRGAACEFVAWQFLCHLNQRETIEFLLEELPSPRRGSANIIESEASNPGLASTQGDTSYEETSPLLPNSSFYRLFGGKRVETQSPGTSQDTNRHEAYAAQRYSQFFGLNALEIATIAHAKRFLSQRVVQRVVDGIWKGEIVFWDSLTVNSTKKPHIFNRRTADPYSRLRVPLYRKVFEAAFFMSFLFLYYAVLVERRQEAVGLFEAVMYVWIVAFAYDELSGIIDAGVVFYQMGFWSLWNLSIIGVGMAFVITSHLVNSATNEDATGVIGLAKGDKPIIELSFDILSLEALFLVPRICSLVSLNSYFGSLIPVLKEMTKAFFRFFPVVVVLYIGFLTTFTMLARDRLSLSTMSHLLVKVFFGSSVLGLDTASEISPIFGYGLMLTFALMTNTLILSSLISLMSMSLEGVMRHAREEYLFQLAIYVLESSNSRRLTYFMPPLNLIPLLCIRPMRLFLSAGTVRRVRIVLLRATHLPFVALIWAYESKWRHSKHSLSARGQGTSTNPPRSQDPHSVVETNRLGPGKPNVDQQAARELGMGQVQLADLIDTIERLRTQVEAISK